MRTTWAQNDFAFGEVSPRALGRFDADKPIWKHGANIIENWLLFQLGGAITWPGTRYVAPIKTQSAEARLEKFQYSTSQQYILEISNLYMRFFANGGQVAKTTAAAWITSTGYIVGDYVTNSAIIYYCLVAHTSGTFATDLAAGKWVAQSILEIPSPFLQADINNLQKANKADVMYIVNPNYFPQKLIRTSATSFTISDVSFVRGPFMDKNITTTTITPSADTGTAITLTASTGIFAAGHVKSYWRIKSGVVKITAFTSSTVVTGDVQAEPDGTAGNLATGPAATVDWAEGAFSAYRGYPTAVTFHEQRLVYGGVLASPGTFYGSVVGAYDNFSVGSSSDSDAYIFQINSDIVFAIRWMSSNTTLLFGTSGGTASAYTSGGIISPKNPPNISIDTDYAVMQSSPMRISSYIYYLAANTYQLRQLVFDLYLNKQKSEDMNLLADHILRDGSGAVQMARQQSPNDRLHIIRNDGQVGVFVRNAEQNVMGWCRRKAGNSASGPGTFESIAIEQQDGSDDRIWVIVKRIINGSVKRYVEYFTPEFYTNDWDAVCLDSSLTYDTPITITGITAAKPPVVTAPSHGFSNGDQIKITNIYTEKIGDTTYGMKEVNENIYYVKAKTTHYFSLADSAGADIDGAAFTAYISGGYVRKMVKVFTGLDHLNGEVVSVTADGAIPAAQQTYTVAGGSITLVNPAAVVHVGLPYNCTLQLLPLGDGSQIGTAQMKKRNIFLSGLRLWRSLGGKIGMDLSNLKKLIYPTQFPALPLGHPVPLYTGDLVDITMEGGWTNSAAPMIVQDQPLPMMLLAVVLHSDVEERQ